MITPVANVNPFVIGLTPENNSDVSPNNLQVVYTFSEPIKQKAFTRTDLPLGSGTIIDDIKVTYVGLKKSASAITFSAQWNASFTQLTITPQGIVGSAKYTVDLTSAFNSGQLTDNANLVVINNPNIIGDFEVLQFSTNGSSPVPASPSLTRRLVAGLFTNLDFGGGTVGLEWNYDPNARSYNIYWSVDGGSFQLLQANFYGIQFSSNIGSLVSPAGAANPLRAISVRIPRSGSKRGSRRRRIEQYRYGHRRCETATLAQFQCCRGRRNKFMDIHPGLYGAPHNFRGGSRRELFVREYNRRCVHREQCKLSWQFRGWIYRPIGRDNECGVARRIHSCCQQRHNGPCRKQH